MQVSLVFHQAISYRCRLLQLCCVGSYLPALARKETRLGNLRYLLKACSEDLDPVVAGQTLKCLISKREQIMLARFPSIWIVVRMDLIDLLLFGKPAGMSNLVGFVWV